MDQRREACVPARLRARGEGVFCERATSPTPWLARHSVATANRLRRPGTATRHVCGLALCTDRRDEDNQVQSMRLVAQQWPQKRTDIKQANTEAQP